MQNETRFGIREVSGYKYTREVTALENHHFEEI